MEIVVIVAISILGVIFVASFIVLIVLCCRHYLKLKQDLISRHSRDSSPDVNLVEHAEVNPDTFPDLELDDVRFSSNLQQVLQDPAWVNDATGLAPHCLAILKTCHTLTEKLVGMTMGNAHELCTPEMLVDIVPVAKRISPRVDEVVMALYPPLDPRLLEARCSALVLAVSHLVLITKNACHMSGVLDWIDQSLADIEGNVQILKDASRTYELQVRSSTSSLQVAPNSETSLQLVSVGTRAPSAESEVVLEHLSTEEVKSNPSTDA